MTDHHPVKSLLPERETPVQIDDVDPTYDLESLAQTPSKCCSSKAAQKSLEKECKKSNCSSKASALGETKCKKDSPQKSARACCESELQDAVKTGSACQAPENLEKPCCDSRDEDIAVIINENKMDDDQMTLCSCCVDTILETGDEAHCEEEGKSAEESNEATEQYLLNSRAPLCCQLVRGRCCTTHQCEDLLNPAYTVGNHHPDILSQQKLKEGMKGCSSQLERVTSSVQKVDHKQQSSTEIALRLIIGGMDCADCAPRVELAVKRLQGTHFINLDYFQAVVDLKYEPSIIDASAIQKFIARATGFSVKVDRAYTSSSDSSNSDEREAESAKMVLEYQFDSKIERDELSKERFWQLEIQKKKKGSVTVRVQFSTRGPFAIGPRSVHNFFSNAGGKLLPSSSQAKAMMEVKNDVLRLFWRFMISLLLCIPTLVFAWAKLPPPDLRWRIAPLILASFIVINSFPFFDASIRSLVFLRRIDLLVLVSISVAVAYAYSLASFFVRLAGYEHVSEPFFETVALLITLIYLGRFTQALTRMRVTNEVQNINNVTSCNVDILRTDSMDIHGLEESQRNHQSNLMTIDKRLLQYGDIIVVGPDCMILTDGIVVRNSNSSVDESSITGESIPVHKQSGMRVYAGSRNLESVLLIQVTNLVHENSLSHISLAISRAFSTRSSFQDLADRLAAILLPVALISASAAFLIWVLVERFVRHNESAAAATLGLGYGIAILVVSCPCALGLSVPLITSLSILTGAREGVLFRSSESIARAAKATTIAFDKTGTLSTGDFTVERVLSVLPRHLEIVIAITKNSKHPIAQSVYKYAVRELNTNECRVSLADVRSIPGKGISANFKGISVLAGSCSFTGVDNVKEIQDMKTTGLSLFVVTFGGRLMAAYGLQDGPRPDSKRLVSNLRAQGMDVMMISGDNKESVLRFANAVGVDPELTYAQCLPEQKAEIIGSLRSRGRSVAFVGDGTNDSIAFAAADVSFAIATASDIAKGTADILLLSSSLEKSLLDALRIARISLKTNILGLSWCVVYAVLAILLAGGVAVRFSIAPRWAGLGEVVSIVPIIILGFSVPLIWQVRSRS